MKNPNRNRLFHTFALFTCLLTSGSAAAQGIRAVDTDSDGWVPVKRLEFTPDDIRGGLLGPEGERIDTVIRADQPSLIELRTGFEAEVVKTMEDM